MELQTSLVELGKVTERAVDFQMIGHFTDNKLCHPNQHGGLADVSPATTHTKIQEHLKQSIADRKVETVVMKDPSAAY